MKITFSILFTVFTCVVAYTQGCTLSRSNLTELSGDDGSGNCIYSIDVLFIEGSGPDNGTLTFSSSNVTILTGAGPHSCACSGNTYTLTFEATCGSVATFTAFHNNSGNGNDCTVSITNTPLPVIWLDIDIKKENDNRLGIYWSTALEVNNDYFDIEYSESRKDFNYLTSIKGSGNSNKQVYYSYSYEHDFSGVVYFRIKQVDFDGNYSYSEIQSVEVYDDEVFIISPNPAQETLYISGKEDGITIEIIDILGNLIISSTKNQISITDLDPGIYYAFVQVGNTIKRQQFIKVN